MKIKEIFEKRIDRNIEEVIKVTQDDINVVKQEISEYVVTESISNHFEDILKGFADAPTNPTEGIAVWVSGFFGSGKSSFAKILGYIIEGKNLGDTDARQLFIKQANSNKITDLLEYIKIKIPTKAIIFDVSQDVGVKNTSEKITGIMYKSLLRKLNYSTNFDLAKLEQDLEEEGKLYDFVEKYEKEFNKKWDKNKKRAYALNEASRILHLIEPKTFPSADSWINSLGGKDSYENLIGRADITPNELAALSFELMKRRENGNALVFVIDEVGQFVSTNIDRMLDLQAIVQAFGVEGRNRVSRKEAIAPIWIVVTSQEKLNEIVSSLNDRRIELARLKDRFAIEIDLIPSDITEVTSKRILLKKPSAIPELEKLFDENSSRIAHCAKLDNTARDSKVIKDEFINLYPYLPYQIDLCIDIMSGIRMEPGATRHVGGSNRTIIKQAQELLINKKVNLAEQELGHLVSLDKVFDLIEGNLSSEKQKDISGISRNFGKESFELKVSKAICLLEYVKDLPRNENNIASVLYQKVWDEPCVSEVKEAITSLEKKNLIKLSDDGYKLLTPQEKNWDIKRNQISAKLSEINSLKKEIFKEIFKDNKVASIVHKNKTFKIAYLLEGETLNEAGDIKINLIVRDDKNEIKAEIENQKRFTREENNKNEIFYIFNLDEEIYRLVEQYYKSAVMISDHERLAAVGKLIAEELKSFNDERIKKEKFRKSLLDRVEKSIYSSSSIFQGSEKNLNTLGKDLSDSTRILLGSYIPVLFPKIRPVKLTGKEAELILNTTNFSGLPSVFYEGTDGLGLIIIENGNYKINENAETAKDILNFLKEKISYGDDTSGRAIEAFFGSYGYGWDRDLLRMVLASLFRGGVVEVFYQGRTYTEYNQHIAKEALVNNTAFKSATFKPASEGPSLADIKKACISLESICGKEIDAEKGAITLNFKEWVNSKYVYLFELSSKLSNLNLPSEKLFTGLKEELKKTLELGSNDCVDYLRDNGKELKSSMDKVNKLNSLVNNSENFENIRLATKILDNYEIKRISEGNEQVKIYFNDLSDNLKSDDYFERIGEINNLVGKILKFYKGLYLEKHGNRFTEYVKLKNEVLKIPGYNDLGDSFKKEIISEIDRKACESIEISDDLICSKCHANINLVESDILSIDSILKNIQKKILESAGGKEQIKLISFRKYFGTNISSMDELNKNIEDFKKEIEILLKERKQIFIDWN